jgi:hypothetical protein
MFWRAEPWADGQRRKVVLGPIGKAWSYVRNLPELFDHKA